MSRLRFVLIWWPARALIRALFVLVYRARGRGHEQIPLEGPVIFAANHQSHFDPPLVGCMVRVRPCAFVARSSLFSFAPFGWLIGFLGAIPLNRAGGSAAIRASSTHLAAGGALMVFPEGTRTPEGQLHPLKAGLMLLVRRTGATVVPAAVDGAYDIWPTHRSRPRWDGRLGVAFGAPFTAERLLAMGDEAALELLRRTIETLRLEVRDELRRDTCGRFPPPGPGDRPYWEEEATERRSDGATE